MASKFTELVIDAHEPRRLAEFWCEVLGYRVTDEDADAVEIADWSPNDELRRPGPPRPALVFVRVPDDKTVKNRVHVDVNPVDRDQDAEVARLLALGARRVDIGQGERSWVVLADPEGNEFCVLRTQLP
jgi:hypothetical protein